MTTAASSHQIPLSCRSKVFWPLVVAAAFAPACRDAGAHEDPAALLSDAGPGSPAAGDAPAPSPSRASSGAIVSTGTLMPASELTVMSEVPGTVLRVHVDEGSIVAAGSPLADLDPTDFDVNLRSAKANLRAAQIGLRAARLERNRTRELGAGGVVPRAALDGVDIQYDVAVNQVALAELGVEMAERRLGQTTIRAPYDVLVANRLVSVGTVITAMPPTPMFRLQDVRNLRLRIRVPELQMRSVTVGDTVEATFASLGRTVTERVTIVMPTVDPLSRTFEVIANVDNSQYDMALRPGMFAEVRILPSDAVGTAIAPRATAVPVPSPPPAIVGTEGDAGTAAGEAMPADAAGEGR